MPQRAQRRRPREHGRGLAGERDVRDGLQPAGHPVLVIGGLLLSRIRQEGRGEPCRGGDDDGNGEQPGDRPGRRGKAAFSRAACRSASGTLRARAGHGIRGALHGHRGVQHRVRGALHPAALELARQIQRPPGQPLQQRRSALPDPVHRNGDDLPAEPELGDDQQRPRPGPIPGRSSLFGSLWISVEEPGQQLDFLARAVQREPLHEGDNSAAHRLQQVPTAGPLTFSHARNPWTSCRPWLGCRPGVERPAQARDAVVYRVDQGLELR